MADPKYEAVFFREGRYAKLTLLIPALDLGVFAELRDVPDDEEWITESLWGMVGKEFVRIAREVTDG